MKHVQICSFLLLVSIALISSCQSVDKNKAARENLSKCHYEIQQISIQDVKLSSGKIQGIDLQILLKISNPTKAEVALDQALMDIFLDSQKVASINHRSFVRIKPQQSATETLTATLDFRQALAALGKKPDNIILKGKILVNILMGSYTLKTPFSVSIEKTVPVPYDQINKLLKQKGRKALGKIRL